jgi:serine/threonine protein kinase
MAEPRPGAKITASLKLVRRLGEGGMGTVWVARHLGLNSDVVVKFITGELARNSEVLARFKREAAAASDVRSPHVVQMLDHGVSSDGLPYIAMELLEGEDLGERITRTGPMMPGEVAGVVMQVARALTRAHEKKIIHRDIKPENIFLCDTGEEDAFVKVLDFGIAKVNVADKLGATATGAMIGSPFWMSPEQILGSKSIDHRTDLWSLGVVAFYALTGGRPFDAETIGGLSVEICHGTIPLPSQRNPQLPPELDAWFQIACARDVSQRFQTARAMADALVAAVGGPMSARVRSRQSLPANTSPPAIADESSFGSTTNATTSMYGGPTRRRAPRARYVMFAAAGVVAATAIGAAAFVLTRSSPPSPPRVTATSASTQVATAAEVEELAPPPPVAPSTTTSTTTSAAKARPVAPAAKPTGGKAPAKAHDEPLF